MSPPTTAIDWVGARARLEAAGAAALASPDEVNLILRQRAERLARPETEDRRAHAGNDDLVVVEVAGDRYGLPAAVVVEIACVKGPTAVPGTPAHVTGVVLRRGQLLTVIDLGALFGLTVPARGDTPLVAVIGAGERRFALLVDRVLGMEGVERVARLEEPDGPGGRRPFCRPVPGRSFARLDVDALIVDPRVLVNQEGPR